MWEEENQLDATQCFIELVLLTMFRARLCASSGARIYTASIACCV